MHVGYLSILIITKWIDVMFVTFDALHIKAVICWLILMNYWHTRFRWTFSVNTSLNFVHIHWYGFMTDNYWLVLTLLTWDQYSVHCVYLVGSVVVVWYCSSNQVYWCICIGMKLGNEDWSKYWCSFFFFLFFLYLGVLNFTLYFSYINHYFSVLFIVNKIESMCPTVCHSCISRRYLQYCK